jgi:restriction endonuclease S subunit
LEQSGEKNIGGIIGNNARKKTKNKWFETQDQIKYSDDFNKLKLVWTPVNSEYKFCMIPSQYYLNNSLFMITGSNLEYLCGILNSKLYQEYFKNVATNGNYNYGSASSFKNIPILEMPKNLQLEIATIVNEINSNKKSKDELCSKIDKIIDKWIKND